MPETLRSPAAARMARRRRRASRCTARASPASRPPGLSGSRTPRRWRAPCPGSALSSLLPARHPLRLQGPAGVHQFNAPGAASASTTVDVISLNRSSVIVWSRFRIPVLDWGLVLFGFKNTAVRCGLVLEEERVGWCGLGIWRQTWLVWFGYGLDHGPLPGWIAHRT
jgi:hypothetical protein